MFFCQWRSFACSIVVSMMLSSYLPIFATTIDVDTIVDADNPLRDVIVVDGALPPTRLTVVDGGSIGSTTLAIDAYDSSVLDIQGGRIGSGDLGIRLNEDSRLHLRGGTVDGANWAVEARDRSYIDFTGGNAFDAFRLLDSSRLRINLEQRGIQYIAKAYNNSRIVMEDGGMRIEIFDSSTLVLHGGVFETLRLSGDSIGLLKGGLYPTGLQVLENSVLRIRNIDSIDEEYVDVSGSAVVHVYGTNLRFDVDDENRTLVFGAWSDGDSFAFRYRLEDQGQIILHEVPEPGAWTLLAIGAAGLFCWRRAHFAAARR